MNILIVSRCLPYPLHLGDRLILYHVARELSARGHEIDLLAFKDRPEDDAWDDAPVRLYFRSIQVLERAPNAEWQYIRRNFMPSLRFPRRAEDAMSPEMWRAIETRLSENRYDVAHMFGSARVYEYFHALRGLPTIIVPYDSYSLYIRRVLASGVGKATNWPLTNFPNLSIGRITSQILYRLQWPIVQNFERWMFALYKATVVVAEADARELRMLNPAANVKVISNGIDLNHFQPQAVEREAATLLFTGNFEYMPNINAALTLGYEVLPKIQAQRSDTRLLLVGNNPPPEMRAMAASNPAISATGYVDDLRPYLARATAFVSPLKIGAGIKNKVLEALAMGLPVVGSPLSVDGIGVEHEREVLVADVENMAEATLRLLGDTALQRQLAANGRALIQARYSWAQVAEQYERLYQAVSNQPSAVS